MKRNVDMGRSAELLFPVTVEQNFDAVFLGIAGLVFLTVSPLVADGQRLVFWSDLVLLAVAVLMSVRMFRRPRTNEDLPPTPAGAVIAGHRKVGRRAARWGVPYVLLALLAATANPDFFGLGFPVIVVASALALDARNQTRREQSGRYRLYRGQGHGRFNWSRPVYRRLEPTTPRPAP